eukprot:160688-Heterocapsa_arctica.AAC.1
MLAPGQLCPFVPTRFSTPCICVCCDASWEKCGSVVAVMIWTIASAPPLAPPPSASSSPVGGSCC